MSISREPTQGPFVTESTPVSEKSLGLAEASPSMVSQGASLWLWDPDSFQFLAWLEIYSTPNSKSTFVLVSLWKRGPFIFLLMEEVYQNANIPNTTTDSTPEQTVLIVLLQFPLSFIELYSVLPGTTFLYSQHSHSLTLSNLRFSQPYLEQHSYKTLVLVWGQHLTNKMKHYHEKPVRE